MSNHSFSFNGTDLGGATYGVILEEPAYPLTPLIQTRATSIAAQDGAVSSPSNYGTREISLACTVVAATTAALNTKLDALALILNEREEVQVIFDWQSTRYYMMKLAGSVVTARSGGVARLSIRLSASDPFAHSTTETTESKDLSVAQSWTLTATGTHEAAPVWTITAGAAATAIVLQNEPKDEKLGWTGTLASGDVLRISSSPRTLLVEHAAAANPTDFTASMQNVSGIWPMLYPGENAIALAGLAVGTLGVVYRARYL